MPSSVTEVYRWVVDDVVEKVQELFKQEGVETSVLNELRDIWLKKLQDSGVMGDSNDEGPQRQSHHGTDSRSMPTRSRQPAPSARRTDHRGQYPQPTTTPNPRIGGSHLAYNHHQGIAMDSHGRQGEAMGIPYPHPPSQLSHLYLSHDCIGGLPFGWPQNQLSGAPVGFVNPGNGSQIPIVNLQAIQSVPGNVASRPVMQSGSSQPSGVTSAGQIYHPQQFIAPGGYHIAAPGGVQNSSMPLQYAPGAGVVALPGVGGAGPQSVGGVTAATNAANQRGLGQGGQVMFSVMQNVAGKRKVVDDGCGIPNKAMRTENGMGRNPGEGGGVGPSSNPNANNLTMDGSHNSVHQGGRGQVPGTIPQRDGADDDASEETTSTKEKDFDEAQVDKGEGATSGVAAEEAGASGDPLGSEEDPLLTDDDDEEDEESGNFLTAQYDKVSRIKTRWRCQLKFGIFHANGRDYLFKNASGEFEF